MLANRIVNAVAAALAWPLFPVVPITTFLGGCLVSLTFGLLMIPLDIIWNILFFWPLLGLSWVWEKAPILRLPVAMIGIPLAVLGGAYASLVPSMGDMESRIAHLRIAWTWPYTLDYMRVVMNRLDADDPRLWRLEEVVARTRT